MMQTIIPPKLNIGDTIGICCPSHIFTQKWYKRSIWTLKQLGFNLKFGANVELDTYGYTASAEERAADLNALAANGDVKMVLFGEGEGAAEIFQHIDFDIIRKRPKLYSSYSDGTSILNAIHAQTGIVTYYGQGPGEFESLRRYDWEQFKFHFMSKGTGTCERGCDWRTLRGGACEGTLIGGYTSIFAMLQGSRYFRYDGNRKHVLFLEDHERFQTPAAIATCIAYIEQSAIMSNIVGFIFGHYAVEAPESLFGVLKRFAERNHIPAVYTDDFGHGALHAILPIGVDARLDADKHRFEFLGN